MQKYCVVFCVQISLVDIIHSRNSFKWKVGYYQEKPQNKIKVINFSFLESDKMLQTGFYQHID